MLLWNGPHLFFTNSLQYKKTLTRFYTPIKETFPMNWIQTCFPLFIPSHSTESGQYFEIVAVSPTKHHSPSHAFNIQLIETNPFPHVFFFFFLFYFYLKFSFFSLNLFEVSNSNFSIFGENSIWVKLEVSNLGFYQRIFFLMISFGYHLMLSHVLFTNLIWLFILFISDQEEQLDGIINWRKPYFVSWKKNYEKENKSENRKKKNSLTIYKI